MKRIRLTGGKGYAIVDDEIHKRVNKFKWHLHEGYACRTLPDKKGHQFLHHFILGRPKKGMVVDHRKGNKLDNRRRKIRFATKSGNATNQQKLIRTNTSGFRGITFHKKAKKWVAKICFNGYHQYLGIYFTKEDAARAYDKAARKLHKEFAFTNFKN